MRFKKQSIGFRNAEFCQYGTSTSIHEHHVGSIYKLQNHLVFAHLLSSFGGVIFNDKIWAALRST